MVEGSSGSMIEIGYPNKVHLILLFLTINNPDSHELFKLSSGPHYDTRNNTGTGPAVSGVVILRCSDRGNTFRSSQFRATPCRSRLELAISALEILQLAVFPPKMSECFLSQKSV